MRKAGKLTTFILNMANMYLGSSSDFIENYTYGNGWIMKYSPFPRDCVRLWELHLIRVSVARQWKRPQVSGTMRLCL